MAITMRRALTAAIPFLFSTTPTWAAPGDHSPVKTADSDPWYQAGQAELQRRLAVANNNGQAKNVILFIADGMGIATITAARIFDGQSKGQSGEENYLSFETFPHTALVKTYNSDSQVPDSAGTASAMNTGVKTRRGVINLWADQPASDCFAANATTHFPATIAEIAERAGLATGVVSTATITHATPAAVYGHAPSRGWESDANLSDEARAKGCQDLAAQLVGFTPGNGLDVALGGGRRAFLPKQSGGKRLDGRNLIDEWQAHYKEGVYTGNAEQFRALDPAKTQRLLGLFTDGHMAYEHDRDHQQEPSLAEMTSTAIAILSRNKKGYFLMVEGGRVDHAHHATNAYRALTDAQAFAQAVQAAVDRVDLKNTLILVTADHSHLFTLAGYPARGNPITGLVHDVDPTSGKPATEPLLGKDGKPFTTLGYRIGANVRSGSSATLTEEKVKAPDYKQETAFDVAGGGHHAGEDVALFATGPQSHLVGGVIEQNTIFHIISHAFGWRVKN